jgi:catalase
MYVQIMTYDQAATVPFNPFDLTKVWSHQDFPLHEVGRLYLNQNPVDYFAQVEQLAFSPSHLIPGIEPSPDKMLQARLLSYPDTHRHRLGANYQQIPCNHVPNGAAMQYPYAASRTSATAKQGHYQRDGPMQMTLNGAGGPNYFPNSFQGPAPAVVAGSGSSKQLVGQWHVETVGGTGQVTRVETGDEDNFSQVGTFFRNVLGADERERLTDNIAGHLQHAQAFIRKRVLQNLSAVDPAYGQMVERKIATLLLQRGEKVSRPAMAAPLNPPRSVVPGRGPMSCPHGYSSKL